MGDSLARIPAIKWGLENYPHVSMTVYWQDYFLELAEYLYTHPRLTHKKISEANWNLTEPVIEFDPDRLTSLALHLTQHAFLTLYDRVAKPEWMQYPLAPPVSRKVVQDVFHYLTAAERSVVFTVASTAPSREWPAYEINALAERCAKRGMTPLLMGSTDVLPTGEEGNIQGVIDDGIDRSLFIDLTNRTTLIEALGIMQRARAVLGVDNGLLHLAHYTTTPVIAGFTSVAAEHRVPFRARGETRIIEAQVPCYGQQSKCAFVNTDYRFCATCPRPYACTLTMSAKRFEEELDKLTLS